MPWWVPPHRCGAEDRIRGTEPPQRSRSSDLVRAPVGREGRNTHRCNMRDFLISVEEILGHWLRALRLGGMPDPTRHEH